MLLHSCAPELPWDLLQDSAINAVSVDASTLVAADLDGIGGFVESGRTIMLGVVPSSPPERRPSAEEVAAALVAVTDRLGFGRSGLRDRVGVTRRAVWPARRPNGPAWRSGWPARRPRLSRRTPTPFSPRIREAE